jgi:hypothetical protein
VQIRPDPGLEYRKDNFPMEEETMRAKKAVRVLVVAALIITLATPAFANWQSLGWAFFGLAAFNSVVAAGALARPYPAYAAPPVYYAPPPVYYAPPPPVYYPSGYYYQPRPYGYYYR